MSVNGNGSGPLTFRWLVGVLLTIVMSLATAFAAKAMNETQDVKADVKIEADINDRQDREIGENYVRIDELQNQGRRIEAELKELNAFLRESRRPR